MTIALQGITQDELARAMPEIALAEARRIVSTVHRDGDIAEPNSGVRRTAREAAVTAGTVPALEVVETARSGLVQSMRAEWTELAFLQQAAGNTAMYAFILAVVAWQREATP